MVSFLKQHDRFFAFLGWFGDKPLVTYAGTDATARLGSINSSAKCVLAIAFLLAVCLIQAQQPRRVIYKTNPVYPPVLKDKQIGGLVRILVVVTPAGRVTQTEDLGGNPVLVTAAEAAVKQWKYEPAANETREMVILRFGPTTQR